jgi:hypothetical protein
MGLWKVAAPVPAFVEDFCTQIPDMEDVKNEKKSSPFLDSRVVAFEDGVY